METSGISHGARLLALTLPQAQSNVPVQGVWIELLLCRAGKVTRSTDLHKAVNSQVCSQG